MKQSQPEEKKKEQENEIKPFHYEGEIIKAVPDLKGHRFKQQGPYLKCESCQIPHGVFIGVGMIMTGYNEDGSPRLVRRE